MAVNTAMFHNPLASIPFNEAPHHYPFHLPPEILSEIFEYFNSTIEIYQSDSFPWSLTHICRFWRDVALSQRQLWSSFRIDLSSQRISMAKLPQVAVSCYELMNLCLKRSRDSPISFQLKARSGSETRALRRVVESLVMHSERWKNASFDIYFSETLLVDLLNARNHTSLLKELSLTGASNLLYVVSAFEHAPELSSLSLTGISDPFRLLRIPWLQITHFNSNGNSYPHGDIFEMLSNMPNLTHLTILIRDHENTSKKIELPLLANLKIIGYEWEINGYLAALVAPSLCKFSITVQEYASDALSHSICLFLKESECQLSKLTLRNISGAGIISILEQSPFLDSLTLRFWNLSSLVDFIPAFILGSSRIPTVYIENMDPSLKGHEDPRNEVGVWCWGGCEDIVDNLDEVLLCPWRSASHFNK